jgi:hypothetical protein
LTINNLAGWPERVDRNPKPSARPAFPHILGVMQKVMELGRQEQPAFDTGASFEQPLEARFDHWISKSKN